MKLRDIVKVAIAGTVVFLLFALAAVFGSVFVPLLGAAIFAGLVGYGLLKGEMPAKYGPELSRRESPIAFWIGGAMYAAGCVGCLIWFVVLLLS